MELQAAQLLSQPTTTGASVTDLGQLAELKGRVGEHADAASKQAGLKEVAQHFESLFVQMMMKAMRDAVQEGELFNSDEMKFHRGMFDQQMSLHLSQSGGIGLAPIIERQLGGQPQMAGAGNNALESLTAYMRSSAWRPVAEPATTNSVSVQTDFAPDNPQQFIGQLWPHATKTAALLGVDAEVLVAQAALETGWGKYMIRKPDGSNSFNLFGIKADPHWQGERASKVTVEYRDGIAGKERAAFRAYQSMGESFADYANFLSKSRYQEALGAGGDSETFLQQLQDSGYATDPRYAAKISALMQREEFRAQVAIERAAAPQPLATR